nr:MAG TPA: hypothetical protein [Caudoviricetes sp.]
MLLLHSAQRLLQYLTQSNNGQQREVIRLLSPTAYLVCVSLYAAAVLVMVLLAQATQAVTHERLICSRQAARAARRGRMVTVALLTAMRLTAIKQPQVLRYRLIRRMVITARAAIMAARAVTIANMLPLPQDKAIRLLSAVQAAMVAQAALF